MDGGAARQAAGGRAGGEASLGVVSLGVVSDALTALRLVWGDEYEFGHDERGYWALPLDRPEAEKLRADAPEELGRLLALGPAAGRS
jgi:hypothetical protein